MADEKTLREALRKGAEISGKFAECKDSDEELAVINEIDAWAGDVEELLKAPSGPTTKTFLDSEMQEHLRKCTECEVVINKQEQGRILACPWWYARAVLPPWPPPDAKPGTLADAMKEWENHGNA